MRPTPTLDLSGCEHEPIQIPGLIQPHGVLFVVDAREDLILQAGGDTAGLLGHEGPVVGRKLREIIGRRLEDVFEGAEATPSRRPLSLGRLGLGNSSVEFTVVAHQGREGIIVEVLPAAPAENADRALARIRAAADRMEAASELLDACGIAARETRRVTGYDRVMVYQFMSDGSGRVIAEERDEQLKPFLNHRYPATDIPVQARELYRQNRLRVIPAVDYTPLPILPASSPVTGEPLDMTHCTLRSVSPVHIKYLKNMGVAASMSVSLLVRGELWGLIACHNSQPKPICYEAQETCAHLGQILSREVRVREELERASVARRLDRAREAALQALRASDKPLDVLLALGPDLQGIVRSDGMAAKSQGIVVTNGDTPTEEQVQKLADWLEDRIHGIDCFSTDRLAENYPEASTFAPNAHGLVAVVLPGDSPLVLIWFRPEWVEEVNWAGNPHEPASRDPGTGTLNPRRSFASWKETVRGRSRPWEPVDLESAEQFGQRAAFLLQQHRIVQLNHGLEQANARLAAIATTDGLTGIANRRAFDERLEIEWKRLQRTGGTLALIILDVDYFKKFNDLYGHPTGDECLKSIAGVLGNGRRAADLAARIGGEEFALLLPDNDANGAMQVAEMVRSGIEALGIAHAEAPGGVVTASIGFAVAEPTESQEPASLIAAADKALYEAKKRGRNRIQDAGALTSRSAKPATGR